MKIQCKNCTKVYLVPDHQFGKSGRKLKCTSCNHIWHQCVINELPACKIQEKKGNFFQNLTFMTLACITVIGICFIIIDPNKLKKVYNTYKDSINYKLLGHKKKQNETSDIKKHFVNEFYQEYLSLSHLNDS